MGTPNQHYILAWGLLEDDRTYGVELSVVKDMGAQGVGMLSPSQSGFAAAAQGPAFDDGIPLANSLLNGHSLGASSLHGVSRLSAVSRQAPNFSQTVFAHRPFSNPRWASLSERQGIRVMSRLYCHCGALRKNKAVV